MNKELPIFNSYMECMSRAYLTGISSFAIGFGSSYFVQKSFSKHLPYGRNIVILASCCIASVVAYKVTTSKTINCVNAKIMQDNKQAASDCISKSVAT